MDISLNAIFVKFPCRLTSSKANGVSNLEHWKSKLCRHEQRLIWFFERESECFLGTIFSSISLSHLIRICGKNVRRFKMVARDKNILVWSKVHLPNRNKKKEKIAVQALAGAADFLRARKDEYFGNRSALTSRGIERETKTKKKGKNAKWYAFQNARFLFPSRPEGPPKRIDSGPLDGPLRLPGVNDFCANLPREAARGASLKPIELLAVKAGVLGAARVPPRESAR